MGAVEKNVGTLILDHFNGNQLILVLYALVFQTTKELNTKINYNNFPWYLLVMMAVLLAFKQNCYGQLLQTSNRPTTRLHLILQAPVASRKG